MSISNFLTKRAISVILLAGSFLAVQPAQAESHHRNVLVIHSYNTGFPWTDDVHNGFTENLERYALENDLLVDVSTEYLDAMRFPSDELFPVFAEVLEAKYATRQPDVVVSCDDDALAFLLRYRDGLFPGVPVLFCGLNYDEFDPSVFVGVSQYAAVVERLNFSATIDLITAIHNPERIAFVIDHTTTGRQDLQTLQTLGRNRYPCIEFLFVAEEDGLAEQAMLEQLAALPPEVPVFFVSFFLASQGVALPPEYIIPRIASHANAPVYTHVDHHMGLGVLGGKLLSGEAHGQSVAEKVAAILNGGFPFEAYVTVEGSNRFMVDYAAIQRFGMRTGQFPAQTEFINIPESLLALYSDEITWTAIALVLLIAAVVLLFLANTRRRSAERKLETSERRYRAIFEKNRTVQLLIDEPTGVIVNANSEAAAYYGVEPEQMRRKQLADLSVDNDPVENAGEDSMALFPDESGTVRQRHHDANGYERDVELHYSRLTLDGQRLVYMLVNDVTARAVAERSLESALDAKEMLIREMNHRIKNNLAMVTALIRLKENSAEQVDFDTLIHQIDAIRIVHEQLYEGTTVEAIAMSDYIVHLLQTVFKSFANRPVVLVTDIEEIELPAEIAVPIGLIINETATNAIKHGFGNRAEITYSVSLIVDSSAGELKLVLENSGEPIPDGIAPDTTESLGLRLIAALADQLQGSLVIERSPHPRFSILFPAPASNS
ncbi:MAG: histidine kinase dimerization/phosphoacceptor domain -containing protein [Spirochaetales bacterium]